MIPRQTAILASRLEFIAAQARDWLLANPFAVAAEKARYIEALSQATAAKRKLKAEKPEADQDVTQLLSQVANWESFLGARRDPTLDGSTFDLSTAPAKDASDTSKESLKTQEFSTELPSAVFQAYGALFDDLRLHARPSFFTGLDLRVVASGLIASESRFEGDFRNAYSEDTFKAYMRTRETLYAVPRGKLAEHLTVEWLQALHQQIFVDGKEQSGLVRRLDFAAGALRRGGVPTPGAFRSDRGSFRPVEMTPEIEQAFQQHGVQTIDLGLGPKLIEYERPERIEHALGELVAETKAALASGKAEPFEVAARFMQRFIAIHPFEECNGRLGRLVMYRILDEWGVPQPILSQIDRDIDLSTAQYVKALKEGVLRTIEAYGGAPVEGKAVSELSPPDVPTISYYTEIAFRNVGYTPPAALDVAPVQIEGIRFAQGPDGFIYDEGGRSYTFNPAGDLVPVAQMNRYLMARRMAQLQIERAKAVIDGLTQPDRERLAALAQSPEKASKIKVLSHQDVTQADAAFQLLLGKDGNEGFLSLFQPSRMRTSELFSAKFDFQQAGSRPSFVMSRYAQIDLEYWHVEQALDRAGDKPGKALLRRYRAELFDLAKKQLDAVSTEPLTMYARLMRDVSPLRFEHFDAYLDSEEDEQMTVWHGAQAFVSVMGVHPDNDPRVADAREVAHARGEKSSSGNLIAELGSRVVNYQGSSYICTTSDLGLLAVKDGFADKAHTIELGYDRLPALAAGLIRKRLESGQSLQLDSMDDLFTAATGILPATPMGHLNVSGVPRGVLESLLQSSEIEGSTQNEVLQRFDAVVRSHEGRGRLSWLEDVFVQEPLFLKLEDLLSEDQLQALQSSVSKTKDLLVIAPSSSAPNDSFSVTVMRRAFPLRVEKKDCLPNYSQVGLGFDSEQEIHLLKRVLPHRMGASLNAFELAQPSPSLGDFQDSE